MDACGKLGEHESSVSVSRGEDFDKECVFKKVMIWKLYLQNKKKYLRATTFVVNISKLHTNSKVLIQEFVWSFEILILNVLDIIYSFYFDYIISMSQHFNRHLFLSRSDV